MDRLLFKWQEKLVLAWFFVTHRHKNMLSIQEITFREANFRTNCGSDPALYKMRSTQRSLDCQVRQSGPSETGRRFRSLFSLGTREPSGVENPEPLAFTKVRLHSVCQVRQRALNVMRMNPSPSN